MIEPLELRFGLDHVRMVISLFRLKVAEFLLQRFALHFAHLIETGSLRLLNRRFVIGRIAFS